jgi:hypothetical protein
VSWVASSISSERSVAPRRPASIASRASQDDMLVSTLYAYVEALGGQVEIRAKFPNQEGQIDQFREIEKLKAALAPKANQKKTA